MPRNFPRVRVNLATVLCTVSGTEINSVARNLGVGGIFIEETPSLADISFSSDDIVLLEFDLPKVGEMHLSGKAVRTQNGGYAVKFTKVNEGVQIKLWQFLKERLEETEECPYCGSTRSSGDMACEKCHWNLNFSSGDYLMYMKREGLIRSLISEIRLVNGEQLRKIEEILEPDLSKKESVKELEDIEEFVGTCEPVKQVFAQIRRVAQTSFPVIILGETGTGKELTARAIHERSERNNMPFLPLNCAAIPETLLEAEFFGYEKGSYTGAHASKGGKIEQADGGTLFLDEVLELSTNLQSKLLRFLDNQEVQRIGSRESKNVDVRLITATNRDLDNALANGLLRPDFYHRLKVFTIHLPLLRDRGEDKTLLSNYFLKKFSREMEIPVKGFANNAIEAINSYSWPGNVREMINKIRRALVMTQREIISAEDLELIEPKKNRLKSLKGIRGKIEREVISEALTKNNYNITHAARTLNISRPYLYKLMKIYQIEKS